MLFKDVLRKLRTENNLTLKMLSTKVDIHFSVISSYEQGKKTPEVNSLIRIADYFGVSTDYLLGRSANTGLTLNKLKLCEKIKFIRKEMKYSQKDFALFIDISLKELEQIENNIIPSEEVIERISVHLNLDMQELNEDSELETSKIRVFALEEENAEYIKLVMKAKEKGLSWNNIVIGEKM